jgi:hypothetical protein
MPVSDVNVLSVNCRPYWIIASYLINIFISIVSPSSGYAWASQTLISEGTYVAMCFGKDYVVVGSDSRGTLPERNSFTDDVCKIVPVSKTVVFFGIGVTNVTGPVGFNVTDIARQISTEGMMLDQMERSGGCLQQKLLRR